MSLFFSLVLYSHGMNTSPTFGIGLLDMVFRRTRKQKKKIRKRRKEALLKYKDTHTPKKSN